MSPTGVPQIIQGAVGLITVLLAWRLYPWMERRERRRSPRMENPAERTRFRRSTIFMVGTLAVASLFLLIAGIVRSASN